MSQRREKRRRQILRREFLARYDAWLLQEPPRILFWRWRKWKARRPIWNKRKEPSWFYGWRW